MEGEAHPVHVLDKASKTPWIHWWNLHLLINLPTYQRYFASDGLGLMQDTLQV